MSTILAIDPGSTESGWCLIDAETRKPIEFGKAHNYWLLHRLGDDSEAQLPTDSVVVEMVASYGMAVGAEVFDTCVWTGRFVQAVYARGRHAVLTKRHPVKVHHCHSAKAKDSNITQALIDRFAPETPNRGKGTKSAPGFFYGFKADIWQAFALAVYAADTQEAK